MPGGGPVTAARLAERGMRTARDLLLRLPRAYEDLRRTTPVGELAAVPDGTVVLVRGTVKRVHVFPRRLLDVFVEEGGAVVRGRWFRMPGGMAKSFPKGSVVALAGAVRTAPDGTRELLQPAVMTAALAARQRDGANDGVGIRPRYPVMPGLSGRALEKLRAAALAQAASATELWSPVSRARLRLPALGEAFARVHAPVGDDADRPATLAAFRRRIALEEALVAQTAFLVRRAADGAPAVRLTGDWVAGAGARLETALGFALTPSQRQALDEIGADLSGGRPMRRLLVGDVGSGKTAVAFGAAALIAQAGGGTLMMVPTEVLAEQQGRAIAPWAARAGLGVSVLTGGTPAAARAAILAGCAAGRVQLLIGTQALLSAEVMLPRLGLVVVDEQHRFGVAQRGALGLTRGGGAPHLLSMSATPIPRSLALALHGDLDASTLTERPGGRTTAAAVVCVGAEERAAAYGRLREAVADGAQGFVVCPLRETGRRPGAVTAIAAHARLRRELTPARVGLLHGGLHAAAKEAALRRFAGGETDVLVATTVIELGIDVPNASVMIVEEADRFGLAQLHQLRGRVGRGTRPGLCFLLAAEGADPDRRGRARLAQLAACDDGFAVAEADLAERGFGDLWGTEQAGTADGTPGATRAALAERAEIAALARGEAEAVLAADPALAAPENAALARAARARLATLFAAEAG